MAEGLNLSRFCPLLVCCLCVCVVFFIYNIYIIIYFLCAYIQKYLVICQFLFLLAFTLTMPCIASMLSLCNHASSIEIQDAVPMHSMPVSPVVGVAAMPPHPVLLHWLTATPSRRLTVNTAADGNVCKTKLLSVEQLTNWDTDSPKDPSIPAIHWAHVQCLCGNLLNFRGLNIKV